MAEFVQHSIEEMLHELEYMEKIRLFSKSETRTILKKRKAFEYKLRRRTKEKEDYLQYIQYEINLLALIKKRRVNNGIKYKPENIEVPIVVRIHKLFKLVTKRFQDDSKLWLSHIEFAKSRGERNPVSELFGRMLQVHNRKPALWILAAKWEFEENNNIENARALMQRGIRFNAESRDLWREFYRLELMNADKMRKRHNVLQIAERVQQGNLDAILQGKVADIVFQNAIDTFPDDVEFWLSFLPICKMFDFTQDHANTIYEKLMKSHCDKEVVWEAHATRNLLDIPNVMSIKKKELEKVGINISDILESENDCFKVFEDAVKKVPTEKMWTLYIKQYLERMEIPCIKSTQPGNERWTNVLDLFTRAHQKSLLAEDLYEKWVMVCYKLGLISNGLEIIKDATNKFPKNVELWKTWLALSMPLSAEEETVHQVFNKAIEAVKVKKSLPLWKMVIEWCIATKSEKTKEYLEAGISKPHGVGAAVKEMYLNWVAQEGNSKTSWNLFERLSHSQPLTLVLINAFIKIENSQIQPKIKRLRRVYEIAVREFGQTDIDLWLDYIRLEQEHPDGDPSLTSTIHWKAMNCLKGELTEEFVAKYTLIHVGKT